MTTPKSIGGSNIGKPHVCVRLQLISSNHCYIIVLVLGCSSIYSSHINHSGQDSITKIFFRASIFRSGLEACLNKNSSINPVSTKCRLQTADRVQNADQVHTVFPSERDNMSSYNLPSVTQSLFRDHLSRLFALMWNIPSPFLDHNRS